MVALHNTAGDEPFRRFNSKLAEVQVIADGTPIAAR
jgi:hypothetical protein